ncbi:outer membrane beta-barrel protein [Fibrobacter sp. UWH4]|uniref:outer membrane beta-barrel protein n=1 Tax=Fibrobacter sp. UWH4 TaxID=1896210 RepID=UPI000912BA5C|nr:outer membrane beta-barrel protein [Fibrobacter sp. UWH4]SHL76837.1 Outer membrane protein beta-barrel domain-containing protein [Fibrobacter sp. UWH4]
MKKIIALAVFLMAFTSASAAINSPNVFGASLTEGSVIFQGKNAPDYGDYSASYTQLAFDALIGFNSRIGLHTGLGLMLNVATFTNGDDDTGYGTHSSDDVDDNMTIGMAITIPAMARFYLSNSFFMEAGATFDINLFEQWYSGYAEEWDSNDEQKLLNVELGAGLGFTLGFGLEFNFRYTYGVTDMYKHAEWSNSRLSLGIGYWFNYR